MDVVLLLIGCAISLITAVNAPEYFSSKYEYSIIPGIVMEAIAIGAIYFCGSGLANPVFAIPLAFILTIICLVQNIRACGGKVGMLAFLAQLAIGAGIVVVLLLVMYLSSSKKKKRKKA